MPVRELSAPVTPKPSPKPSRQQPRRAVPSPASVKDRKRTSAARRALAEKCAQERAERAAEPQPRPPQLAAAAAGEGVAPAAAAVAALLMPSSLRDAQARASTSDRAASDASAAAAAAGAARAAAEGRGASVDLALDAGRAACDALAERVARQAHVVLRRLQAGSASGVVVAAPPAPDGVLPPSPFAAGGPAAGYDKVPAAAALWMTAATIRTEADAQARDLELQAEDILVTTLASRAAHATATAKQREAEERAALDRSRCDKLTNENAELRERLEAQLAADRRDAAEAERCVLATADGKDGDGDGEHGDIGADADGGHGDISADVASAVRRVRNAERVVAARLAAEERGGEVNTAALQEVANLAAAELRLGHWLDHIRVQNLASGKTKSSQNASFQSPSKLRRIPESVVYLIKILWIKGTILLIPGAIKIPTSKRKQRVYSDQGVPTNLYQDLVHLGDSLRFPGLSGNHLRPEGSYWVGGARRGPPPTPSSILSGHRPCTPARTFPDRCLRRASASGADPAGPGPNTNATKTASCTVRASRVAR